MTTTPPCPSSSDTRLAMLEGVEVRWDGTRLAWTSGARIDADGSPRAYGPGNTGLDWTANAGHPAQGGQPANWYGVVTDTGRPDGKPVVQGAGDPFPGFYVSATAYERPGFARQDPRRYLDSEKVCYVVIPGPLRRRVPGVVLGCKAVVRNLLTGVAVEALVGDVGPADKIGEISMALATALGIPNGARQGGTEKPILAYEVYPGVPGPLDGGTARLIAA